jgi:NitT/TauT family transport system substrate-binding protein
MMYGLHRPARAVGRSRWAVAIAGVSIAALALTGCSSGAGAASGGGGDSGPTAITVATLPTANLAALRLGMKLGYFTDEGLKVTTQDVQSGSAMITGTVANKFDFMAVGYVPAFTAVDKKLPIRIIAGNDTGGPTINTDWQVTMVGKDSRIKTVKDLATATIGVNALKGVSEVAVRASLREQGIDDSKIKLTEIPFPEMPAALAAKTIDAAYTPEPFVTEILNQGGRVADAPYAVLGKGFPNGAWGTSLRMIDSKPKVVAAFTRAITKSLKYAAANPDAVREIIPTYTKVPAKVAAEIRLPVFSADLNLDLLHKLLGYTKEFGVIEKVPSDADLFYKP